MPRKAVKKSSTTKPAPATPSTEGFTITKSRIHTYPWGTWFNGQQHILCPGTDYHCTTLSIMQLARQQAKARNIQLTMGKDETGRVLLQAQL